MLCEYILLGHCTNLNLKTLSFSIAFWEQIQTHKSMDITATENMSQIDHVYVRKYRRHTLK